MSKNTTYLLGILATIVLGTLLYLNLCSECQGIPVQEDSSSTVNEETVPPEPEPSSFPFALSADGLDFTSQDNFNFNLSSPSFLMPLATTVGDGVEQLKTFLGENENMSINLTGLYRADEANPTAFPNLGLARANSVKNHLVISGISSSQINTFGKLEETLVPDESTLLGPITFGLSEKSDDEGEALQALYDKIKAEPLILYFNTGEAAINLTAEQRQKVADISKYLDKASDAQCLIVGHTDNTGQRATNIQLGKERADFAKAYLIRNGIMESKILTDSKGPDQPMVSNDTEEGRSKNRRTVVTLK
ncbi:MAG: OmpA family protein [Bacteroidota bacterium]